MSLVDFLIVQEREEWKEVHIDFRKCEEELLEESLVLHLREMENFKKLKIPTVFMAHFVIPTTFHLFHLFLLWLTLHLREFEEEELEFIHCWLWLLPPTDCTPVLLTNDCARSSGVQFSSEFHIQWGRAEQSRGEFVREPRDGSDWVRRWLPPLKHWVGGWTQFLVLRFYTML